MEHSKHIIVIDDDDDDCLFLQQGLQYQMPDLIINRFLSGDAFLHSKVWQTKKHTCKLILLELVLPGEDGLDWLNTFLQHECCQDVPVVMYSCLELEPQTCKQAGAADYITKPCDMNELNEVVERICTSWLN